MSLFVISDLHLCVSNPEKNMGEFGGRWNNYIPRLVKNWNSVVSDKDSVIIPGDISWAMGLNNSLEDIRLIHSLKGTKYIGKGNHDLWWDTMTKMSSFLEANHLSTIKIVYNNAHLVEDKIVCGTRGWFYDEKMQKTVEQTDYVKVMNREVGRLKLSLDQAMSLKAQNPSAEILVFLHFPPIFDDFICKEIIDVLHAYGIKRCFYGHIHGNYDLPSKFDHEGIAFSIVSADYLSFVPLLIR